MVCYIMHTSLLTSEHVEFPCSVRAINKVLSSTSLFISDWYKFILLEKDKTAPRASLSAALPQSGPIHPGFINPDYKCVVIPVKKSTGAELVSYCI